MTGICYWSAGIFTLKQILHNFLSGKKQSYYQNKLHTGFCLHRRGISVSVTFPVSLIIIQMQKIVYDFMEKWPKAYFSINAQWSVHVVLKI